jgi:TPR repeat protein
MLPRGPPSLRPSSPTSVYSNYSYYNLDSATPSPTSDSYAPNVQKKVRIQNASVSHKHKSTLSNLKFFKPVTTESAKAYEYLQMGIQCHEDNKMEESAAYFEKSAKEEGGSGVGMLMWGLTLRHGWGCNKNEKGGFKWLSKAAESAVADLDLVRKGGVGDPKLLQSELVIAIYEVGQCFFHGWGVQKDQKMAVSYYAVAARLGDSDAQSDLGFCLANGKGCKKDRKEAAKWYRAAVKQGVSDIGLAWIYKDKYQ